MRTPFGKAPSGLRLERMQSSKRYRDGAFHNIHPMPAGLKSGAMPSLADFLCGGERRVPAGPLPARDPRAAWSHPPESGLRLTWLGHSTLLVELDGVRVLTDPVWGQRASPLGFAGPKRFQPVPVALEQLPALDAVVISHDHYDHLDYATIVQLAKTDVPFVTGLGVGAHLEAWGVDPARITELDWWESTPVGRGRARLTAAPSQHFSGRGPGLGNSTAWSSFALRGERHGFFFSGDTGLTSEYATLRERLGPLDVVALEVGAFHPAWGDIHLGPENALKAFELLGGAQLLPVHWVPSTSPCTPGINRQRPCSRSAPVRRYSCPCWVRQWSPCKVAPPSPGGAAGISLLLLPSPSPSSIRKPRRRYRGPSIESCRKPSSSTPFKR